MPKSIWQKCDSQPVPPQGVDVVERVKMEEYLQHWCVSEDQHKYLQYCGAIRNYTLTPKVASCSKETLLPNQYSIQVILYYSWGSWSCISCVQFPEGAYWSSRLVISELTAPTPTSPKTTSSQPPFSALWMDYRRFRDRKNPANGIIQFYRRKQEEVETL